MYVSLELFSSVRIKFNAPHRNNVNVVELMLNVLRCHLTY